jgi:DNA-binding transcriptional MerR regulator
VPRGTDEQTDDLTIDELARAVGMTVRNVRAYAARGLLAPPRLAGRTGYYGNEHVEQLSLVRDLLEEGLTLAAVERVVAADARQNASLALAMLRTVREPWRPEAEEEIDALSLAIRAGVPPDPGLINQLAADGVVRILPDGRLHLLQPDLIDAGQQVIALGVPPEAVLAAQPLVAEHAKAVAKIFVDLVATTVWRDFVERGMPAAEWERMRDTIAALVPIAGQALLASFRAAMRERVDEVVPTAFLPGASKGEMPEPQESQPPVD